MRLDAEQLNPEKINDSPAAEERTLAANVALIHSLAIEPAMEEQGRALRTICNRVIDVCGGTASGVIRLVSERGELLWLVGQSGSSSPRPIGVNRQLLRVLETGHPASISGIAALAQLEDLGPPLCEAGMQSLLLLPLRWGEQGLGLLWVASEASDAYAAEQRRLGALLAMHLTQIMTRSHVDAERDTQHRQLETVLQVIGNALKLSDLHHLLAEATTALASVFDATDVQIGALGRDELVLFVSDGSEEHLALSEDHPAIHALASVVEERIEEEGRRITLPLRLQMQPLGILIAKHERPFSTYALDVLRLAASVLSLTLENRRLYSTVNTIFVQPVTAGGGELATSGTGDRRDVTILWADLYGAGELDGAQPADQLLKVLNHYLDIAASALEEYAGTMELVHGQGLIGIFNLGAQHPDHPSRAVRAALAIQNRIETFHRLIRLATPPLWFRIGIHTGTALVGQIGPQGLRRYSAMGEPMMLAQGLRRLAQRKQILISKACYEAVQREVVVRELPPIALPDRQQPVEVCELLGFWEGGGNRL
jgi:class 3 adenylate cyclase